MVRTLSSKLTLQKLEAGITARVASPDDLHNAIKFDGLLQSRFISAAFIEAALSRGDICIGVFDQSRLVSYHWLAFSTVPYRDGIWVGFEKPYYYSYNAYTDMDYRGRHLRVPAVQLADKLALSKGYKYALLYIETHNYSSIESSKYTSSKLVGYAGYVKLFGKVYPFRSRGAKKHCFSFYQHSD